MVSPRNAAAPFVFSPKWWPASEASSDHNTHPSASYTMKRTTCSDRANSRRRSALAGALPDSPAKNSAGTLEVNKREARSEEHTSELQSQSNLVCRLLLEKKKKKKKT